MTYSNVFKLTAVKLSLNLRKRYPLSVEEVADMMDIGRSTLYSWRRMYMFDHICFGDKKYQLKNANTYYRKINDVIIDYICNTVIESGTVNTRSMMRNIRRKYNTIISRSYIYQILKKRNITYKKCQKYKCPYSNEMMEGKRKRLLEEINKVGMSELISLDETSIEIGDKPNYGWSCKGEIIKRKVDHNRKRYSLIMAISKKKVIDYMLVKGSFNAEKFNSFIERKIGYCRRNLFMDNARIHHNRKFKGNINKDNYSAIYNVPYCPKYNPIEFVFNVIKSEIKKRDIGTLNELDNELKKIIRKLNQKSFSTYYNHSYNELNKGYP